MTITGTEIKNIIFEMTKEAQYDEEYAFAFINRITKDSSLLKEFITYICTKKFTSDNKVRGYGVVDILVWQMDHFKAFLDRDQEKMKSNECRMILEAFDTFMKMKENPNKYIDMLAGESGSDYDGKF